MPRKSRSVLKAALFLTVSALAVPVVAQSAPPVAMQDVAETRIIELTQDSAIALTSDGPFRELSVANPAIADISTISNTGIYVVGKTPGRTTLMLMGEGGDVMASYDVRVVPDISELKSLLRAILPDADIEVFTASDGIVLSGYTNSEAEKERAEELASRYAPDRVSNLLTVASPDEIASSLATFAEDLAELLPGEAILANVVGGGIVLSGTARSERAHRRAFALAEQVASGPVMSFVEVDTAAAPAPDAAEVARNLARILPGEAIELHVLGDALVLSGQASSEEIARRAVEIARLSGTGATISNMIEVSVDADCELRTRRGIEVIVATMPCREDDTPALAMMRSAGEPAPVSPAETDAGGIVAAGVVTGENPGVAASLPALRPRPRSDLALAPVATPSPARTDERQEIELATIRPRPRPDQRLAAN